MRNPHCRRAARDVRAAVVGVGFCLQLTSCSSPDGAEKFGDEPRAGRSSTVSAATWTDGPWPFTIERGELKCIDAPDGPGVFILTGNGNRFALNPAAIRMAHEVGAAADLDPIWREHPDMPGVTVNVSPMIVYALALC